MISCSLSSDHSTLYRRGRLTTSHLLHTNNSWHERGGEGGEGGEGEEEMVMMAEEQRETREGGGVGRGGDEVEEKGRRRS